ncbi:hypothetical protein [Mycolicibacter sinensis]
MLGSLAEADDAVQEAGLRLTRCRRRRRPDRMVDDGGGAGIRWTCSDLATLIRSPGGERGGRRSRQSRNRRSANTCPISRNCTKPYSHASSTPMQLRRLSCAGLLSTAPGSTNRSAP